MDVTILVNKEFPLSSTFVPSDLVQACFVPGNHNDPNYVSYLTKEAYTYFLKMNAASQLEGYHLLVDSGYRSYDYQQGVMDRFIQDKGIEYAHQYVAPPGASEHQTGLSFDVAFLREGVYTDEFEEDAPELKWMFHHAHEYGFILRYPQGKKNFTGYNYEPWHFRYVGIPLALILYNSGDTLEEYYQKLNIKNK